MSTGLKVLIIEDSEDDATLLIRQLQKGGYDVIYQRVETNQELIRAIENGDWDIIISDFRLPGFSGLQALQTCQAYGVKDTPFIIVSGAIGEETAVEMMRAGAHDYLMKDNLARLAPVVTRELADAKIRSEAHRAEVELRESEEKYRSIFSSDYFALCILDVETLEFVDVNEGFCKLYDYDKKMLLSGMTLKQLLEKDSDESKFTSQTHKSLIYIPLQRHKKRDGEIICVEISAGPLELKGKKYVTAMVRDITSRVQAEEKLRYLSTHDSLTGLYNRNFFETEVQRLERGRQYPISIFVADLDGLKYINDSLGHPAGDALLKNTANVLLNSFRSDDIIARLGGDEFAVLLPDMDENSAEEALDRLKKTIQDYNLKHITDPIELSIGVATGGRDDHIKDLFRLADDRMYQDKIARKKNRTS
ncbi:MAG: diguanylate cyclase [Anaerolineae bacterium]|nr:diguanylate cyclase [Anaerolineae bacterium]